MKNFALIGAAGYIAERHMKAIKETGNNIIAATDTFDVMGRMDSFFPNAEFFLDFDLFKEYIQKNSIDFASICSPNFMHSKHIRTALELNANAICEKPLVLYPEEIEMLEKLEIETGKRVYNILQLRLHPTIIALKEKIEKGPADKIYDIDLSYITSRGKWYYKSWKGDIEKSGGVATNIGIHFFDMLRWIFGEVQESVVHSYEANKAAGFLQLKNARVRWFLSLDYNDIPSEAKEKGMRTYRSITVEKEEIEFSGGFTDLHTQTYTNILNGGGFGITQAKPCIQLTHAIRNSNPIGLKGNYHPFLRN
ncbi:MAG: Gfo/Idh/MocA family oxidoreductase [Prolixibacteraceae bacterium]|jgi:UDP-N-acetyl-2-amino-2-deoxyglucuronate dehydrogenase|nr:Gfo/Idh/MocA family oxidoreductase [Prolixibacteraceae bacterium]